MGRQRGILIPVLIDEVRPPLGFGGIQSAELSDWSGSATSEAFQKLVADITATVGPPHPQATSAASSIEPNAAAPTPSVPNANAGMDEASSPIVGELRDEPDAGESVADRLKCQVEAPPAAPTRKGAWSIGYFTTNDKRVRWSQTAVSVIAILALGLYWLAAGKDNISQPRPTTSPSPVSALQLNAVMTERGTPVTRDVMYDVYETAEDVFGKRKLLASGIPDITREGPARFPLPPGRYYVTARYGSASASMEVAVTAAAITRQILNLRAGVLSLTSVLAAGGKPPPLQARYDVYEAAEDAVGNRRSVTSSFAVDWPVRIPLPAGRYYVTVSFDVEKGASEVIISQGEVRKLELRLGRQNDGS